MRRFLSSTVLACVVIVSLACAAAQEAPNYERKRDVIYGRKFGTALTMDVFTPNENANGAGIIAVVSGGWFSSTDHISPPLYAPFLKRGYTVFAVVHGSQPKYTIPEIVEDMHRAVRFIRHNAKEYKIDPDRLGITGGSAGGHLSLMIGTAGTAGDPKAKDPVDRESSKVQAVACFFPPTDFLNYGEKGKELIDRQLQPPFTAAVDFHEFDPKKALYLPVTDKDKLREICREISPITHVSAEVGADAHRAWRQGSARAAPAVRNDHGEIQGKESAGGAVRAKERRPRCGDGPRQPGALCRLVRQVSGEEKERQVRRRSSDVCVHLLPRRVRRGYYGMRTSSRLVAPVAQLDRAADF